MICGRHQNLRVTAKKEKGKKKKTKPYSGTFILEERFNPDCVGFYITHTSSGSDSAESSKVYVKKVIAAFYSIGCFKFVLCTRREFGGT